MRPQTNRLPASTGKGLAGAHIDRQRPIRFTINGRVTPGFAGDTVLSALLAAGVDTIGTHSGQPLGLRASAAPAIVYTAKASAPEHSLPMERTPARDGAEYRTFTNGPAPSLFARLFPRAPLPASGAGTSAHRSGNHPYIKTYPPQAPPLG